MARIPWLLMVALSVALIAASPVLPAPSRQARLEPRAMSISSLIPSWPFILWWRPRVTPAPTVLPTTVAPTTAVPATSVPETDTPTTAAPTTPPPTTVAPTTTPPPTAAPTTALPPTAPPATAAPTTAAPTTVAPTTAVPTTAEPTTAEPTTAAPTTTAPTTAVPTTAVPTTAVPTTAVLTTAVPTTVVPTTSVPSTAAPTTAAPTTVTPTTASPTTVTPTTAAPTTPTPTTVAPTTSTPDNRIRSIYSWDYGECILDLVPAASYYKTCGAQNAAAFHQLQVSRLIQPFGGAFSPFNRVYWYFDWSYFDLYADRIATYVQLLRTNGVAVEFLDGQATWVTSDAAAQGAIDECAAVAAYNSAVNPVARFAGIGYDIEPHVLGAPWRQNATAGSDPYNALFKARLVNILTQCRVLINSTRLLDGSRPVVSWAAGDDYPYYVWGLWETLRSTQFADYVVIMDYYNNIQQFWYGTGGIGGAVNVLQSLEGSPVRAVFAAEFQSTSFWPASITVYSNGTNAGMAMLGNTTEAFRDNPNFLGVSVHYDVPFTQTGFDGPIPPPGALPTCALLGRKITVNADLFYYKSYRAQTLVSGTWTTKSTRALTASPASYSFPTTTTAPYRAIFYSNTGGSTLNYLPVTVLCQ